MGGIGGDPVEAGFVASLARPGGNVTGLTALAQELSGKQLELRKELVPRLSQVAVLGTATLPGSAQVSTELERAAGALQVQLHYLDVRGPKDVGTAFREARARRADAVLVLASPVLESHRTQVADLAAQHRLPTIYPFREFVEAGGLVSYGVSIADLYRRAATYVDKILKGAKSADLPVCTGGGDIHCRDLADALVQVCIEDVKDSLGIDRLFKDQSAEVTVAIVG